MAGVKNGWNKYKNPGLFILTALAIAVMGVWFFSNKDISPLIPFLIALLPLIAQGISQTVSIKENTKTVEHTVTAVQDNNTVVRTLMEEVTMLKVQNLELKTELVKLTAENVELHAEIVLIRKENEQFKEAFNAILPNLTNLNKGESK